MRRTIVEAPVDRTPGGALAVRLLVLGAFVLWVLLPIAYMVRVAFSRAVDVPGGSPNWLAGVTFENIERVFGDVGFMTALLTSTVVAVLSTAVVLLVATPAAYVIAILPFRGRRVLETWILSTRMMPPIVVLVPYFALFRTLGLLDTVWALVIGDTLVSLALAFFLLRSFFADVPPQLHEAAVLDGCSPWRSFISVSLPLVRNGLAAAAALCFIFSWNDLIFALTVAGGETKTGPTAIYGFISYQDVAVGPLMAAALVLVLPVAALVIVFRRSIVRGLSFGAVKG